MAFALASSSYQNMLRIAREKAGRAIVAAKAYPTPPTAAPAAARARGEGQYPREASTPALREPSLAPARAAGSNSSRALGPEETASSRDPDLDSEDGSAAAASGYGSDAGGRSDAAGPAPEQAVGVEAGAAAAAPTPEQVLFLFGEGLHVRYILEEPELSFQVVSYYAAQFEALRALVVPGGEATFLQSLSRCTAWKAEAS